MLQGVIAGQGLAIVRDVYATRALHAASIMLAIDAPVPTPAGYFVVVQTSRMTVPKIVAFRQWIMSEVGAA